MTDYKRCRMCLVSAGDAELSSLRENGGSKAVLLEKLYGINLTNDNQEALICENCSEIIDLTIAFIENARRLDETYFAGTRFVSSFGSDNDWPRVCRCCQSESYLRKITEATRDLVPLLLLITGIDVHDDQDKCWICSSCKKVLKSADSLDFHANENQLLFTNETDQEVSAKESLPEKKKKEFKSDAKKLKKAASARVQCAECSKSYSDFRNLRRHIRTVHEKSSGFTCNFCDFKTTYQNNFTDHLVNHVDAPLKGEAKASKKKKLIDPTEKKFTVCLSCQLCSKDFESAAKLARHYTQKHQVYRKFECDYCGWRGLRKHQMTEHITCKHLLKSLNDIFDNERRFKCTFKDCKMRFKTQTLLKQHAKTHSGVRYPCEWCQKSYSTNWKLKKHQQTAVCR